MLMNVEKKDTVALKKVETTQSLIERAAVLTFRKSCSQKKRCEPPRLGAGNGSRPPPTRKVLRRT